MFLLLFYNYISTIFYEKINGNVTIEMYNEAESVLRQSLVITEISLGTTHPRLARITSQLANMFSLQGDYPQVPKYPRKYRD